ncbi:DUF2953 domain-containing protein [Paenibacillus sp. JSM ZJ436]|uniref:DUF2953 domain-containing protein n=1 Tax=Paenibacillus sp. JSM ZJ436 TaxID=3376190 RepID=UPI00379F975C
MNAWVVGGLIVGGLLLVCACLVLGSTVKLGIRIKLAARQYSMVIHIHSLYGLFKKTLELPLHSFKEEVVEEQQPPSRFFGKWIDPSGKSDPDARSRLAFQDMKKLLQATDGFKTWMLRSVRIFNVSSVFWSTSLALDDAAQTATASGALWGIKHMILGWLSYHVKLHGKPELFIIPDFNGPPQLSSALDVDLRVKVYALVKAGLALWIRVWRVEGGLRTWKSTLQRELDQA